MSFQNRLSWIIKGTN